MEIYLSLDCRRTSLPPRAQPQRSPCRNHGAALGPLRPAGDCAGRRVRGHRRPIASGRSPRERGGLPLSLPAVRWLAACTSRRERWGIAACCVSRSRRWEAPGIRPGGNLYPRDEIGRLDRLRAVAGRGRRRSPCTHRGACRRRRRTRSRPCRPRSGAGWKCRSRPCATARRWRPASGKALVLVEGRLEGVLGRRSPADRRRASAGPAPPLNPGDVDFESYARAERRLAFLNVSFPECVTVIERGSPWHWRRGLDALRQRGDRLLWQHIAPAARRSGRRLAAGAREQLDVAAHGGLRADQHDPHPGHLRHARGHPGRLPVLRAAVGHHLAPHARWPPWLLATVLYTLLTDAPPSAVRAMILVLLVCLAMFAGRPAAAFNCWAAGGLVVLALNPADLFRAGPQLSFLAVAAMAWMAPRWAPGGSPMPSHRLILQTRPWPHPRAAGLRPLAGAGDGGHGRDLAGHHAAGRGAIPHPLAGRARADDAADRAGLRRADERLRDDAVGLDRAAVGRPVRRRSATAACGSSTNASLGASRLPASYFWITGPEEWWLAGFYLGVALVVLPCRSSAGGARAACRRVVARGTGAGRRPQSDGEATSSARSSPSATARAWSCERRRVTPILYDAGRLGSPAGGARSIAGTLWVDGHHAAGRRGDLARRHRSLQRPAGIAGAVLRSTRSTSRR